MEKVKHVVVGSQPVYIYKGKQYIDKPSMTIIKGYEYDKENNTTFIKVRKSSVPKFIVVLLILIGIVIYASTMSASSVYNVTYTKFLVVRDGYIQINATLGDELQGVMDVDLECEGQQAIETTQLYSGSSVGSVPFLLDLAPGDYEGTISFSLTNSILPTKLDSEVTIRVMEDSVDESVEE